MLAALAFASALDMGSPPPPASLSYRSATRLIDAAVRSGRSLELRGRAVNLGLNEIKLRSGISLVIQGPGCIKGSGHSLFAISGNRCFVTLADLSLFHSGSPSGFVKRESGAAIWVRTFVERPALSHSA